MKIESRLARAERWALDHKPVPMWILAELPDGSSAEMLLDDAIEKGAGFARVLRGGTLRDIDRLLSMILRQNGIPDHFRTSPLESKRKKMEVNHE